MPVTKSQIEIDSILLTKHQKGKNKKKLFLDLFFRLMGWIVFFFSKTAVKKKKAQMMDQTIDLPVHKLLLTFILYQ